jgi:thioredoxin-dependent peroxiredoxin
MLGVLAMIEAGQAAPDFTLKDQDGHEVTLSRLTGQAVVLYFYPRDDTPGCTKEACAFRDARAEYAKAGAKVIGVSPDTLASHKKFAEKFQLPFTLVADPEKSVCQSYGVWQEKTLYGKTSMGVVRTTFLIDGDGIVRHVFPKVKVDGHSEAVLEAIRGLKA